MKNTVSQMCGYNATIILLLNLLGAKNMEVRIDSQSIMRDVEKCLGVFYASSPLFVLSIPTSQYTNSR